MTNVSFVTREQARKLAIAYAAFTQAAVARDKPNAFKWAKALSDLQRETGVTLLSPGTLADHGVPIE